VTAPDLRDHALHAEAWRLSPEAARAIAACRARGGRVIPVGTTSVRVLESAAGPDGLPVPGTGRTQLFIHPPWRFRLVDALLTNFHAPSSTLLMLVSALAGRERLLAAYEHALRSNYRFLSYGDAMFIA
jgi:S-adenosylmethionine:tRNA ribosyltransferase-isomerase